uniref:Uncharacterized protein n=1 Tax=Tanacetum cinerariifolium TaxID=118510 RepID=A0A6L2MV62_TANCI|nr:hypothetical protein [Tanacetum cinerariifolium]
MTHPYSNRNVVPTAVLTRSRLVSLNAARPVPIVVPQSSVKSPWPIKHVVNKAHSPIRRPINHRPATKNSNFNKKVTTVKVNKVNAVQGTKGFDQIVDFLNAHTIQYALVCISAKRTAWNDFSCSMASAFICLATVADLPSHNTCYTSPTLTQKVFANIQRVGKCFSRVETPLFASMLVQPQPHAEEEQEEVKVAELEQDKHTQALEILKLKKRVKKLEKKKRSKSLGFKRLRRVVTIDAEPQGRINQEDVNTASKGVHVAELYLMMKSLKSCNQEQAENDDLERAQVLQKQYDDKEENIDWNVIVEKIQERHLENIRKYQSLKKKPVSIAQARKNMIFYLKNMAGYKMEHFRGMTYDKETPSNDPKEMSKEDVQNMLEIVPVSEFKVETLQVKFPIIDWEIHIEGSRTYWKIIRVGGITEAY